MNNQQKTAQAQYVLFHGVKCDVIKHQYRSHKQTALCLVVADDPDNEQLGHTPGYPFATATVAIPGAKLNADEVIIKDYSENTGLLRALVDAGWVEETGRSVSSGFIQAPVARLVRD